MKSVGLILGLLFSASCIASDPQPSWGSGWSANVWNSYCDLKRDYFIPYPSDPERRGFLSGSSFNGAFVRFATTTKTHADIITEEQLDVLRFELYVHPETGLLLPNQRIRSANLGGFESKPRGGRGIHIFSLDEDQSYVLLERFLRHEVVKFELRFADGTIAAFEIHPSGDRNFGVWEAMFQTCIRHNR